jgi:hypothetical protein
MPYLFPIRSLFPSFERSAPPPRYLNIRPEGRGIARKVAALAAAVVAVGIVLPAFENAPAVEAAANTAATPVITAATPTPVMAAAQPVAAIPALAEKPRKLYQALCGQKTSARRDCADIRAAKEARLVIPAETTATPAVVEAAAQTAVAKPDILAANTILAEAAMASTKPAEIASVSATPPAPPARVAARQKPKKPRPAAVADDAPMERLVHIYDQIAPDGRRMPVYRRSNGSIETGTIVDDEYRPSRRVALEPQRGTRYFGLQ